MNPGGERGEAFVVWLDRAAGNACQGHVERVATSERVRFTSSAELIAVIRRAGEGGAKRPSGSPAEEP